MPLVCWTKLRVRVVAEMHNRNTVSLRREVVLLPWCGFKCETNLYHLEGLSQTAEPFLDVLISALPQIKGMKMSVGASRREES